MSWYYAENNERRGPLDEADFQALVTAGTINLEAGDITVTAKPVVTDGDLALQVTSQQLRAVADAQDRYPDVVDL